MDVWITFRLEIPCDGEHEPEYGEKLREVFNFDSSFFSKTEVAGKPVTMGPSIGQIQKAIYDRHGQKGSISDVEMPTGEQL